jgi:hypothetical protein
MNVILAFDELRLIAIIFSRPQHASFTDSDQAHLALKQKHQWAAQLEERPGSASMGSWSTPKWHTVPIQWP